MSNPVLDKKNEPLRPSKSIGDAVALVKSSEALKGMKEFFTEVTTLTFFTGRFFKELFQPRYEFNELYCERDKKVQIKIHKRRLRT